MNNLTITERRKDAVVILDLKGQIRLGAGNTQLREAIAKHIDNGTRNILLNLEGVSHIDSCGLAEIIAGYIKLKKNRGSLKLLNLTSRVRELMVITKLLTVVECFKTESDAINSFRLFFNKSEKTGASHAVGYQGL